MFDDSIKSRQMQHEHDQRARIAELTGVRLSRFVTVSKRAPRCAAARQRTAHAALKAAITSQPVANSALISAPRRRDSDQAIDGRARVRAEALDAKRERLGPSLRMCGCMTAWGRLENSLTGRNVRLYWFRHLIDVWSSCEYTNTTAVLRLPSLLRSADGGGPRQPRVELMRRMTGGAGMIPVYNGYFINLGDVLLALANSSKQPNLWTARDRREFSDRVRRAFPELEQLAASEVQAEFRAFTVEMFIAQTWVHAAYRRNCVVGSWISRMRDGCRKEMVEYCETHALPVPAQRVMPRTRPHLGDRRTRASANSTS